MTVTILDIAHEAGVSKSTVSLVINNRDSIKVETRLKVQEAIKKLGYVPNMAARELATNRKHTIGLVFLTQNASVKPYEFDAVVETLLYDSMGGIEDALRSTDYTLLTERFNAAGGGLPQIVRNKRVDGIIIVGGLFGSDFIELLKKETLPAVIIGRHHSGIASVAPDVTLASYQAVRYLIDAGYRNIAFVNGPSTSSNSAKKQEGYLQALAEAGLPVEESLLRNAAGYTAQNGYDAAEAIFTSGKAPDALFGGSDGLTAGTMRYLYRKGLRVPDDISIIGYEDSLLSVHATPGLTTIDLNKAKMGEEAATILLSRIEKPCSEYEKLTVPPTLVIRESVKLKK